MVPELVMVPMLATTEVNTTVTPEAIDSELPLPIMIPPMVQVFVPESHEPSNSWHEF